MNKSNRKGDIPNRWLHCPRKASGLIADKFLAFKTPLSERYDDQVPIECRFPPKMLFDQCKMKKIKLGLWIDLTNTNRFYNKKEVENHECKYYKLQCRGHGETPSPDQTHMFINVVHNFIAHNPLDCVAVHCTHGFNRTGFLIISYLVEKMDCAIEIALDMFAKVRPPGIYKADYLEELYRRYGDVEDTPPPPNLPDWCFDEDSGYGSQILDDHPPVSDSRESLESEASSSSSQSTDTSAGKARYNKRRGNDKKPEFMVGVPGVEVFDEQPKAFQLQKKVQVMCEWKRSGFPGCQPVSMDMNNINLLHQKPYRVSWKADGTRYMMLIDGPGEVYFFDRDHNIFRVENLQFLHRKDLRKHLSNTLLDGEMVIDKVNGEEIPRYLAYDIIKFENQDVGKTPFYPTRLHCLEHEIIGPRIEAIRRGIINKTAEPFSIRKKEFWEIDRAEYLLGEKFASTLSHEPDGLIFQPAKDLYVAGRCDDVLKWKPLDMNSVDFKLKIVKQGGLGKVAKKICCLYVGQQDTPFAGMKYTSAMKDLDGKIVECKFEDNQWKFMRERTDKSYPNSVNTAKAVCASIVKPVTKQYLVDFIKFHKFNTDSECMPPPSKKIRR